jgi:hypothetical protein
MKVSFKKYPCGIYMQSSIDAVLKTIKVNGAYSGDSGHPFRSIPATYSDLFRPAVPGDSGHPVGAERRWS